MKRRKVNKKNPHQYLEVVFIVIEKTPGFKDKFNKMNSSLAGGVSSGAKENKTAFRVS